MLPSEKTTLTAILKNNDLFKRVLDKLTLNKDLTETEKSFILTCALVILNEYNKDRRFKSYADLSYYIILKYSLTYRDYKPLYDFSVAFGFYPISNTILKNDLLVEKHFNDIVVEFLLEDFINISDIDKPYIETFEQNKERNNFVSDISLEKGYIAPTSFGKSSVIVEYITSIKKKEKIAVIVPTKSLLMQTYKMIRDANLGYRILMHNEMYNNDDAFISVFTQERALRLLKTHNISYDTLIIDEAHNVLDKDNRSILLGRLLRLNKKRKADSNIIYLSPLIDDIKNLNISAEQNISPHTIDFNIKSPEIYEYTLENILLKHNKFFINESNTGLKIKDYENYLDLIKESSKRKNFLYNYRPIYIEELAKSLLDITTINESQQVQEIIDILKKEVHEKFYCIPLLKNGIIYLHGKLPDLIKEYLEKKFKEIEEIKFVVANSVILEGMNLPIDNLYILNTFSQDGKALTNLIGRVNRLNEIFKGGNNLDKLLPSVYFINNEEYNNGNSMFNKIKLLRNRTFSDTIKNPLLEKFSIESIKDSDVVEQQRKRENIKKLIEYEDFLILDNLNPQQKLKQYFIENSFNLFYKELDFLTESIYKKIIDKGYLTENWNELNILDKIYHIFIEDYIDKDNFIIDFEFFRLKEEKARNYYDIHIKNRKKSLKENIQIIYSYLKTRKESPNYNDHIYYIGSTYGEIKYKSDKYFNELNNFKVAINLKEKTDEALINYAIVKLKIEDDFISFKLNKFIVFLNDYNIITKDEYHNYIYGTTDEAKIELTKFGLTIGLIERLQNDKQIENLSLDENNNLTSNLEFGIYLNNLNDFQRFEIERFLN